jgi:VIT1/CCC1 family predicted Fe2+/Mn2+ transporter
LAALTRRSVVRGALRQAALLLVAFAVTSLIGRAVGSAV